MYTGTNAYGNRILGIIIEEGTGITVHYFHIIVKDQDYTDFVNKTKTLKKLFTEAGVIFALDRINHHTEQAYVLSLQDIPEDYLPQENSYCPDVELPASLNFGISLKGKKADEHLINTHEGTEMQTAIENLLKTALHSLLDFDLKPEIYLEPAEIGSFRLNYQIQIPEQNGFFPVDETLITKYLKTFLDFLVSKLPTEDISLAKESAENESLQELEGELNTIYASQGVITKTSGEISEIVRESLSNSAEKLKDVSLQITNSKSFSTVQLLNYQPTGEVVVLGTIDETYSEKVNSKLIQREQGKPKEEDKYIDPRPTKYRILVYELNVESGNCYAYIFPDDSENYQKVKIDIDRGEKQLTNSIYSRSQHEEKVVTIVGIAEKLKGKFKVIHVKL